ncbi:hypothetical protein DKB58_00005 [Capnocytophaga canimorsus]|uniref:hypothetical protein n=1 Tax=Capnocytophaga canimorsus TaxID=28188 RepID=UPI000D6E108A|nr:hypothetical protein [Capnocytophaga canimorsus]AWL79447.1 hypothetical protein DKB58_00005 [Capnocytophaga canimorsus]
MDKYVKRTQRDYSMSFKLNIVKEIESGSLSTCGACKKHTQQELVPKLYKRKSDTVGKTVPLD